jgi:hypothetical protein
MKRRLFKYAVSTAEVLCYALYKIIVVPWVWNCWRGVGHCHLQVISRYSPEGTDVTSENAVSVRGVGVRQRFEWLYFMFLSLRVSDLDNFYWYVHFLVRAVRILVYETNWSVIYSNSVDVCLHTLRAPIRVQEISSECILLVLFVYVL